MIFTNTTKAMDIVKPPARTEYEAWLRWLNRIQSELATLPYYGRRKIKVIQL
jgi:hypothetical protein